ncbi:helix-turn-helix domain-containing protein [Cytobacillus horneckiae]|nr:helix-turn-helix transcriptional regulator [Cytobacillus horneckiae]MEC1155623.1 helix-turn-helix domain-containing protein [Cytobacillus horneckiae]MED2936942.1 helix-turn-helix domain-containing protein [Cytobacillus horneckiae]
MQEPNLAIDIKNLREKKGIGSRELSRLINKAPTYISQLERGLIKNPDPLILVNIFLHLGHKREAIDDFLYNVYQIETPNRKLAEEAWIKNEIDQLNDPNYQERLLEGQIEQYEQQMEWLDSIEKKLHERNEEIKRELAFFIDKNIDTFTDVINNLHTLVMKMSKNKADYDFFTQMFKRDISDFNEESKKIIIETIKGEYEKSLKEKGWWGEPPSF